MSDDWNNNQQNQWHQNDQPQGHQDQPYHGDQGFQTYQQPEHQQFEPTHEPHVETVAHEDQFGAAQAEPVVAAPSLELIRLDAIEAAIHELRAHIDDLKASLHAPAPVAHEHEAQAGHVPETDHAQAVVQSDADRLSSIETEIKSIKALIGTVSHTVSDLHADVKSTADLHAETRGIVDEQHQLMRGLNYIITSAVGTLTASAKTIK